MGIPPICNCCKCPDVGPETFLIVVDPDKPDKYGRERFTLFWLNQSRIGTIERRPVVPGKNPYHDVYVCGHRAQEFFTQVETITHDSWRVEVVRGMNIPFSVENKGE